MNIYNYHLLRNFKVVALAISIVFIGSANTKVMLCFNGSVTVNDTAIYLKDIATVHSDMPALSDRIAEKMAGPSAPPGHSRFVSAADVITYCLKPIFKNIDFKSNKIVHIRVKTGYVEKKICNYNDLILRELKKHIAWKDGDWSLVIDNSGDSFKCYNAPLSIAIKGVKDRFPRGALRLQFIANQFGKSIRIPLSCRIMVTTTVLVAKNNIPRDMVFSITDCEAIKKDISGLGPEPFFSFKDLVGKKACRTINAGSILTHQMVRKAPDVYKGDNLSITVTMGNVKISVAAVARENGFKGQKIWVQNTASNKLIRVMVTDKKSACLL